MKVDLFDFDLPEDRIAQQAVEPRDAARLLDLTGRDFADRIVRDLPDILRPGDLLVCNDTKVIPTRLTGKRGEARVEVTLHKQVGPDQWWAFAKPARKLRIGENFVISGDFHAEVMDKTEGGEVLLRFNLTGGELITRLWDHGVMPLPPYIKRSKGGDAEEDAADRERYQTVFAKEEGAVAAPTAGLHFTDSLNAALEDKGIGFQTITLHVGAGTFLPVKVEDTRNHIMHSEFGVITPDEANRINDARAKGGRIVAVGTTSLRLLESAASSDGDIKPFEGETDIFITPGYRFKAVDLLMTNFHLPKSTLFMLVSAFAGLDRMKAAYKHAIEGGYRFYSYGDTSLLAREDHLDD